MLPVHVSAECFLRQPVAFIHLFRPLHWVDGHPPLSLGQSRTESWGLQREDPSLAVCSPADGRETAKTTSWPLVISLCGRQGQGSENRGDPDVCSVEVSREREGIMAAACQGMWVGRWRRGSRRKMGWESTERGGVPFGEG